MRQFASLRASAASAQAMMQVAGMPVGADGELWESVAGALPDPAGDCPEVSGPFPAGRSGFRDGGHGSGRDGDAAPIVAPARGRTVDGTALCVAGFSALFTSYGAAFRVLGGIPATGKPPGACSPCPVRQRRGASLLRAC